MSILLALAELFCAHKRTMDNVSLKDAMLVGLAFFDKEQLIAGLLIFRLMYFVVTLCKPTVG